jgi:hypothetical protein
MQDVVSVVVDVLAQDFVVNLNFFSDKHRVRMEVHQAAVAQHFAQSMALNEPDLFVDLVFVFHQSQNKFFSHDHQNGVYHAERKVDSQSGVETSVLVVSHEFKRVLRRQIPTGWLTAAKQKNDPASKKTKMKSDIT